MVIERSIRKAKAQTQGAGFLLKKQEVKK